MVKASLFNNRKLMSFAFDPNDEEDDSNDDDGGGVGGDTDHDDPNDDDGTPGSETGFF